ncbi:MAG: hypothetical protein ACREJC_18360, partial [Tepidisphaeraceae bacterium]
PDLVRAFLAGMEFKDHRPVLLVGTPFNSPTPVIVDVSGASGPTTPVPQATGTVVTVLPAPSIPQMLDLYSGQSNVAIPDAVAANVGGDNSKPSDPAGSTDSSGNPPEAPVVPAADAVGVDKTWVTAPFKIPTGPIAKSFFDCKIPKWAFRTVFLEVRLYREELSPDGTKWINPTLIKSIATVSLIPTPPQDAAVPTLSQFLQWAIGNQDPILQPKFFEVLRGDGWHFPGGEAAPAPVEPVATTDFDPSQHLKDSYDELMKLTSDQRRQVAELKQKLKDEADKQKKKPGGPGRGKGLGAGGGGAAGGGGGIGGARGPDDPDRPAGRGSPDERGNPPAGPQQPGAPAGPTAAMGGAPGCPIPTGEFDPSSFPDVIGWAIDDTVEPGRTYHYRIGYSIKNPMFQNPNMVKPEKLAAVLMLVSDLDKTEWSKPISIPARTTFYIARNPGENPANVRIEVFAWQGGVKRSKIFDVAPGDMVGGLDAGVDFATGWTLVDIPKDLRTNESCVLLMDPNGILRKRDYFTDQANPAYQDDKKAVSSAGGSTDALAGTR